MLSVQLLGFSNENSAKEYFENYIVNSPDLDGIMIKSAAFLSFLKNAEGTNVELGGGEELFFLAVYPAGTGIRVDTSTSP